MWLSYFLGSRLKTKTMFCGNYQKFRSRCIQSTVRLRFRQIICCQNFQTLEKVTKKVFQYCTNIMCNIFIILSIYSVFTRIFCSLHWCLVPFDSHLVRYLYSFKIIFFKCLLTFSAKALIFELNKVIHTWYLHRVKIFKILAKSWMSIWTKNYFI